MILFGTEEALTLSSSLAVDCSRRTREALKYVCAFFFSLKAYFFPLLDVVL